jgi:hypothetical protein
MRNPLNFQQIYKKRVICDKNFHPTSDFLRKQDICARNHEIFNVQKKQVRKMALLKRI